MRTSDFFFTIITFFSVYAGDNGDAADDAHIAKLCLTVRAVMDESVRFLRSEI